MKALDRIDHDVPFSPKPILRRDDIMAIMLPDSIPNTLDVTAGEKRVFRSLQTMFPDDFEIRWALRCLYQGRTHRPGCVLYADDFGLLMRSEGLEFR